MPPRERRGGSRRAPTHHLAGDSIATRSPHRTLVNEFPALHAESKFERQPERSLSATNGIGRRHEPT